MRGPRAWLSESCLGESPQVTRSRGQKQGPRSAAPAPWVKVKCVLGKTCVTEAKRANPGSGCPGLLRRGRNGRWKGWTSAGQGSRQGGGLGRFPRECGKKGGQAPVEAPSTFYTSLGRAGQAKREYRGLPGGPVTRTLSSQCSGAWVRSLVGGLDPTRHN